jgi:hypothetical protein
MIRFEIINNVYIESKSSSPSSACSPGAVCGNGSNILDSSDFHSETCECSEGGLGSGSWGFGLHASSGAQFYVQAVDFQLLATRHHVMGRQHRC